jgi:membrane protein implicated in regulation of membrane protease activity
MPSYYIWFIVALCCAGGEIVTGTFYLLALAISLFIGGLADLLGASLSSSLLITAAVAVSIFIVLKRAKKKQYTQALPSLDIGQSVTIIAWHDNTHARIQYRGTQWDAELIEDSAPLTHAHYEIAGQKGNIFLICRKK